MRLPIRLQERKVNGRRYNQSIGTPEEERHKICNVHTIFLHISGAFNNPWWPDIIYKMKEIGCSGAIINLVRDYQRLVTFRTETGEVIKEINKGCPQGSLLGAILWNLVFDGLLLEVEKAGYKIVAYADDGPIMIEGKSRRELQEKGQAVMNLVDDW